MTTALVRYEAARHALQAAYRVDEVKDIRDKAEAMAAYARQAKDTALVQWATEIKVRAERRAGEMLKQSAERGERATRGDHKSVSMSNTATLTDMGITRDQSSRWQKVASIPEDKFERAIEEAKGGDGEITTAALLRIAKKESVGTKPKSQTPEKRFDEQGSITKMINAIRSAAEDWPKDVDLKPLIDTLRREAKRLEERKERLAA